LETRRTRGKLLAKKEGERKDLEDAQWEGPVNTRTARGGGLESAQGVRNKKTTNKDQTRRKDPRGRNRKKRKQRGGGEREIVAQVVWWSDKTLKNG